MGPIVNKFYGITEKIIQAGYRVHDELGSGFLERVYESALCSDLAGMGMGFERQKTPEVFYRGNVVGEYVADLVAEGAVVVEIKAVKAIVAEHRAQCLQYLKCLHLPVGLITHIGAKFKVRRFLSNQPMEG